VLELSEVQDQSLILHQVRTLPRMVSFDTNKTLERPLQPLLRQSV
jgi:hypothetical protein